MRASPIGDLAGELGGERPEVDTVLLADGINADQMLLVTLQPARRGGVSRYRVAAQDIQPQCVHLWSALCPSDTHARFVQESQSFRRAVRGFYDTRGKVAFRAFDRGEARDQVERHGDLDGSVGGEDRAVHWGVVRQTHNTVGSAPVL